MSESLVDKLLESFDKLEDCIAITRAALEAKSDVPENVICRVNQYSDVVAKQRRLAASLSGHLKNQNWTEVSRHVRLINGLSSMIRDDAQEILHGVSPITAEAIADTKNTISNC